jgi:MoaA/NifB/PqqE/SkfB family radical SAM enzyme
MTESMPLKRRAIIYKKKNRNAFANFLKANYEKYRKETLVKSYPYIMLIDVSSICQLRCPMCPTGIQNNSKRNNDNTKYDFRKGAFLSKELFDNLIDELGDYLFEVGLYNWGEPLLHKNLTYFLKKLNKLDIRSEINSNLSLKLSDYEIEELLFSGIDLIHGSIDGFSQKTYENYRRGGNFNLAKENITRLASIRDKLNLNTKIVWSLLVFSFNEHEIENAKQYCTDHGIYFITQEPAINTVEYPHFLPSYRKHEATLSNINQNPRNMEKIEKKSFEKKSCDWHYLYSLVNADGSVSPCCVLWDQKHDFGRIIPGERNFADIWNNNKFRLSRAHFVSKNLPGLSEVDTICLDCIHPERVKKLYTHKNMHVISRFYDVFSGIDPILEKAFSLIQSSENEFINFYSKHVDEIDESVR